MIISYEWIILNKFITPLKEYNILFYSMIFFFKLKYQKSIVEKSPELKILNLTRRWALIILYVSSVINDVTLNSFLETINGHSSSISWRYWIKWSLWSRPAVLNFKLLKIKLLEILVCQILRFVRSFVKKSSQFQQNTQNPSNLGI